MKPQGSRGREAFSAALATLAAYRPDPAHRPPPYQYLLAASFEAGVAASAPLGPRVLGAISVAAAELRAGRTTSLALVEEALRAVDKLDPELNAVAHLMAAEARAEAAACDADGAVGSWRGPLHGVPVTVKDIIDVAGAPTRAGSLAYEGAPTVDAEAVARVRAAGAVILAKVTTHEFALGVTSPQSRNPHDPTRIPGGSSGGSAIAVCTGMGLGSIGTDTRASIRAPAALSGVVGFKPTFGAVPTRGVVPLSWTMDHVAVMATTVGDAALLLDALLVDPLMATGRPALVGHIGRPVTGMRVGVPEAAFAGAEPEVAARVWEALDLLQGLSCRVAAAPRPSAADFEAANAAGLVISRCEAASFHRALGADRALYWEEVADQLDAAGSVTAIDYIDAQRLRGELTEAMLAVFDDCDVLAMPTAPIVAPLVADFASHLLLLSRNAIPWSLTGLPAVSIPCGRATGLPVGLQLVAPPGREDQLIAVGTALEYVLTRGGGR